MTRVLWIMALALLGTSALVGAGVARDEPGGVFQPAPRDLPAIQVGDGV